MKKRRKYLKVSKVESNKETFLFKGTFNKTEDLFIFEIPFSKGSHVHLWRDKERKLCSSITFEDDPKIHYRWDGITLGDLANEFMDFRKKVKK